MKSFLFLVLIFLTETFGFLNPIFDERLQDRFEIIFEIRLNFDSHASGVKRLLKLADGLFQDHFSRQRIFLLSR